MDFPKLPNDLIIKILIHRKNIKQDDRYRIQHFQFISSFKKLILDLNDDLNRDKGIISSGSNDYPLVEYLGDDDRFNNLNLYMYSNYEEIIKF